MRFLPLLFFCSGCIGAGSGTAEGVISSFAIPASLVERDLPEGLVLDSEFVEAEQAIAVSFMGTQRDLRSGSLPLVKSYREFTLGFFVEDEVGREYIFLPYIRVDNRVAQRLGQYVGLHKEIADFQIAEGVISFDDDLGLRAQIDYMFRENYERQNFERHLALMQEIQKARPLVVAGASGFRCMDFDWKFNEATKARPVRGVWDLSQFFGVTEMDVISSPGLDESLFGSFWVETRWTMSRPYKCRQ